MNTNPVLRPKVYVAGPITKGDQMLNIRNGILACDEVARAGFVVFNPFLTFFWHMLCPHVVEFWYNQDNNRLIDCDALLRLPGESVGADAEIALAKRCNIAVYYSLSELIEAFRNPSQF